MFTCMFQGYVAATVLVLKHSASFTEGADSMRVKRVNFGGHICETFMPYSVTFTLFQGRSSVRSVGPK